MTDQLGKKTIVISGGGTGGHLYPGLAVADEFRRNESQVHYLGSKRGLESQVVPSQGYPFTAVASAGLAGSTTRKLWALLQLGVGTVQAYAHLRRWNPQLLIGTGGYVCVPAVLAARLLGVPVVLLEQNAAPGRATKLLSRWAARVCVSFQGALEHFPSEIGRWTGNPVRSSMERSDSREARERLGLDRDRRTLLVTGASQGAASINRAVLEALPRWRDHAWTVLHLTGRNHLARVSARAEAILPEDARLDYRPFGFRKDIQTLYSAADLVVSRAGATTIAELTTLGLPSLLIPYPHAGGHQVENARELVDRGGAELILDEDASTELAEAVESLLLAEEKLGSMSEKCRELAQPNASVNVFEVCCEVME